ncbi:uncharacterized protein Z518_00814 [Rhinocladiella mackenziei CBS 650.93]|uniref:Thioesterase n=1 Tax=Rhinocladiella mackenziei CBS 650.93 TaxID=1442369 RepID=A0A0D2HGC4_9EURO|nr:uncharacterized protein Z518_00814 [Rhinocladiella mackenziei CBS 650.93]KIX09733.1 hypothetical protein Z518_00814 [Rhinocladiella mackenziei CBS 650.93]
MPSMSFLASWRTVALVFALINLKALPLAWHFRLFYHMFTNWYTQARVPSTIKANAESNKMHALFGSVSIFSHSPFLEIDYNLHKSNSTYFTDLDESRTALMTKVLIPSLKQGAKNLEKEGHKGRLGVVLGSVHTSFHREIKPYERYEVRSRVLGWDKKWIVIGSWFIRPAQSERGKEVVLASALSKYVVKKGRFTVSPERCFMTAGWLPPKPENCNSGAGQTRESSEDSETQLQLPPHSGSGVSSEPSPIPTPEGLPAPVREQASQTMPLEPLLPLAVRDKVAEWDWHRIEMERIRGLRIADNWLALDKELLDEYARGERPPEFGCDSIRCGDL